MRTRRLLNVRKVQAQVKARTAQIKVGATYFLSGFYDQYGAMVKVLDKTTEINNAGWASSVKVEFLEPVGDSSGDFYKTRGRVTTVNASNLYERRELANPQYRSMKAASANNPSERIAETLNVVKKALDRASKLASKRIK